jgi:threonyl-tRNA synthetase
VTGDYRPEKLGAKIRDGQLELIPYMLVVGPRDVEQVLGAQHQVVGLGHDPAR